MDVADLVYAEVMMLPIRAADRMRDLVAVRAGVFRLAVRWPAWSPYLAPYAIGSVAMFWVIERVGGF